ncbi:C39 family peptidase [Paenibacillus larvae]|uniref:Peptidase C39-like domain-containing protein n=1 Tax=Paenibacillus larvae subsp. larvae TaxID=147375 RepID=A0A6C0QQC8_9BACL|nr:papain-like cysteine protease family protein [Paenibacillus larvae]MCY9511895.1 C39 family peptidase [Paenibacillus larvae]MCY9527498.1 C39 family peptidase [Paenibacillus larvae]QHZ50945.1 hypothetical protein ERICV_01790 [Paenibacillus larvae subsp. larvae]
MRILRFLSFLFLILILATSFNVTPHVFANYDSDIPLDIQKYAEGTGLEKFKELVLEDPTGYGFQNADEVKKASLGHGFQVHLLDSEKFKNASSSLIEVSKPTGQYEFIILSRGEAKSFLTVEKSEKGIRVVLIGGDATRIGKSLDTINSALSKDHKPILVKDGIIRYLVTKVNEKEVNVPDVPTEKNLGISRMDNNNVWDSDQTIKHLKKVQAERVNPDADGTGPYPIVQSNVVNEGINHFNISNTSLAAQVFTSSNKLKSYPIKQQEKSNWCWAASSTSILKFKGINVDQCDFVKHVKSTTTCNNVTANVKEAQSGMHDYGLSSKYYKGNLSVTQVQDQIDEGNPIYVSWGWKTGGGHAIVIYGYNGTLDPNNWYIKYMDPWDGIKTTMEYENFKGGTGYDRTWRWGLKDFNLIDPASPVNPTSPTNLSNSY